MADFHPHRLLNPAQMSMLGQTMVDVDLDYVFKTPTVSVWLAGWIHPVSLWNWNSALPNDVAEIVGRGIAFRVDE